MLMRRILCCCLILLTAVFPLLASGCGLPSKAVSDPLPLDGTAQLKVGDYVEVQTIDGEHFRSYIVSLGSDSFKVGSKEDWSYASKSVPYGLRGKRTYQLDELSLLREWAPGEDPRPAGAVVLGAVVGTAVVLAVVLAVALALGGGYLYPPD